jgi:hypothetical protein
MRSVGSWIGSSEGCRFGHKHPERSPTRSRERCAYRRIGAAGLIWRYRTVTVYLVSVVKPNGGAAPPKDSVCVPFLSLSSITQ